ncbi:MAG TPA: SPOR domain-containing protein [Alicycliphilus sp.]|jgi:cell division protein FtsN|uniref:SPOR domain-containing protein n=1 Tax=Diaphorobacter limosus TaxID=3036128 RepID=A0ABZ0J2S4_9BURK|nr:SPOR domain-containing protein [Diaphorobacter sp. Y-1]MBP7324280.1 SPOR domain-containing protein [Alicycliphilus sp.]MCA0441155.1 SPOR domain-containing protein [Pseudomonadota bacterium]MBP7328253.1 SPOR domain-containing protein [Alicycliphilus sp.]MBP8137751.1 SPOR domain-containing protein [Alicycliphilus sp.]TXJ16886.1 MAG: sporulation protein [Alicycliphilus sp.]
MKKQQRGGTVVGFILGVIVGLGGALAVAVYVTKVPVPFLNKNGTRAPDQDAAEAKRNKDWDPNAPLYGKNPARPVTLAPEAAPAATPEAPTAAAPAPRAAPGNPEALPPSADPLGDLARAKSKAAPAAGVDPFEYFVQAGAFRTQQDADAQRAKLAMLGWEARVSERETNGRVVFRVRIGPFSKRDDAESLKDKLDGAGVESALVRVQR